jgi:hypothetical protein
MTQYTRFNKRGGDVSFVVGAEVVQRVPDEVSFCFSTSFQFSRSCRPVQFEVVPDKCYKIVKSIIVARPRKGQMKKALNKHSTSY